jgi:hypothetical protein
VSGGKDTYTCCTAHGGDKRCQKEGCTKSARGDTGACTAHGGGRRCQHEGCPKAAAGGGTQHCIAHGGGKRCQAESCTKSGHRRHGCLRRAWGGKRCQEEGCLEADQGDTGACNAHGGGRRCQHLGCPKGAASGGTQYCIAHGGGKRCQQRSCFTAQVAGGTQHCIAHGGGKRCQEEGCTKAAIGDTGACRSRAPPPPGHKEVRAEAAESEAPTSSAEAMRGARLVHALLRQMVPLAEGRATEAAALAGRKALLVGVNYEGATDAEVKLTGAVNDAHTLPLALGLLRRLLDASTC